MIAATASTAPDARGGLVEALRPERLLAVRTFVEAGWRAVIGGGSEKLVLVELLTVLVQA